MVEKVLRGNWVSLFPNAYPANMADCARNGVFIDPYRAMPWPLAASGRVPSHTGRRCGVPESRVVTPRRVGGEMTIRRSL